MAKPKKSRAGKTRKPVDLKIPMLFNVLMIGHVQKYLALHTYMAIETLISRPTVEATNNVGAVITIMAESLSLMRRQRDGKHYIGDLQDPSAVAVVGAMQVFLEINARYDATHALTIEPPDEKRLRAVAGLLDSALNSIPKVIWDQAVHNSKQNEDAIHAFLEQQQAEQVLEAA